jgi:putative ABC transport system ATP-binding protein
VIRATATAAVSVAKSAGLKVEGVALGYGDRMLLDGASLLVPPGQSVAVLGRSGSGKSTFLNAVAGVSTITNGSIWLGNTCISALSVADRSALRLRRIGLVFQHGELLPELSLVENVALPVRLGGIGRRTSLDRAEAMLDRVGLSGLLHRRPEAVSGGELQRAAIARALATEPDLVLADEPTGALDAENAQVVLRLLLAQSTDMGASVIVATHDKAAAAMCDEIVVFQNEHLVPGR